MSSKTKLYDGRNFKFEYKDIKYKLDFIHPSLEQEREKIIISIQNKFKTITKKYIKDEFIRGKNDSDRILDTMLSRFIMNQLAYEIADPVIPSKVTSYAPLENDLLIKLKKDKSMKPEDRKKIIKKIIKEFNLDSLLKTNQNKLFKFKPTSPPTITKTTKERYIVLSFNGDTIEIYNKLYNKLIKKYDNNNNKSELDIDVLIWCLIKRYIYLKSYNQQLAVHPLTMKDLKIKFRVGFELFGSALNTYFDKYCSLFYDIEKYFGSFGSLNFLKPIKGNYTMNPPFDEFIIANSSKWIISNLKKSKENIRIFVWIPIWDKTGIEFVEKECNNNVPNLDTSKYGKYEGLITLEESGFMKCKKIVCLQDITYYNYMWFKSKKVANTYLIVLDNYNTDCKQIDELKLEHMINQKL